MDIEDTLTENNLKKYYDFTKSFHNIYLNNPHLPFNKLINLTRNQSCIICKTDISMNFIHYKPFYLDNSSNVIRNRRNIRNFTSLDIQNMSPRTRYRYGIPFTYQPRRLTVTDNLLNYICCKPLNNTNPYLDSFFENLDTILVVLFIGFISTAIVVIVMLNSL